MTSRINSLKIFIFALVACPTWGLLSIWAKDGLAKLKGAERLLADPETPSERLTEAFGAILKTITTSTIEPTTYQGAIKAVIRHTKNQAPADLPEIAIQLDDIQYVLSNRLIAESPDIEKRFDVWIRHLILSMKQETDFRIKSLTNFQQPLQIPNRVKELKARIQKRLAVEHENLRINKKVLERCLNTLNAAIPDDFPEAQTFISTNQDNFNLLTYPAQSLREILLIQIGLVEIDPIKLANTPVELVNRIKDTISIWHSVATEEQIFNFVKVLFININLVEGFHAKEFFAKVTPELVEGARRFLASLIGYTLGLQIRANPDSAKKAFEMVYMYYAMRTNVLWSTGAKNLVKTISTDELHSFIDSNPISQTGDAEKLRKYTRIMFALQQSPALTQAETMELFDNLQFYMDITDTEVATMNTMTAFFNKYANNSPGLERLFFEFLELISTTDQSSLTKTNVFQRLDKQLAQKAKEAKDEDNKWLYAVIRLANYFQSGDQEMIWVIEPLDDCGLKVFYEKLNSSLFNGFDGTISTLVRNDKLGNPPNEAVQKARELAAEKLKKLKKESGRHASVSEWQSNIFDNFLVMLAPGFSINAEKLRLILKPKFI